MCEKHPLSNTCFPRDDSGSAVSENSRYKVFRSQEKTKLEAEEACKNIGIGWSLAFLKTKEWNHFSILKSQFLFYDPLIVRIGLDR